MRIVKVNATASTNSYLREFCRSMHIRDDILLWTDHQFSGSGQRGTTWESEPFKNLTFSVSKRAHLLPIDMQFYITMAASLAIFELLKEIGVERISVKWPNDILAGSRKLCGILIESVVKNNKMDNVIVGVGLNVNQINFEHAPKATSLKLEMDTDYELPALITKISQLFEKYIDRITTGDFEQIKADYESRLFKKDKPASFSSPTGHQFIAIIKGVSHIGKLILQHEDNILQHYGLKELKMHY